MISDVKLFKRKNTGVWYIRFERGKERSTGTRNRAEALTIFNHAKRAYLKGKIASLTGESTKTLSDFRDEFIEWSMDAQPQSTFRANRLALDKLMSFAGGSIRLDQISQKHVDQMVAHGRRKGLKTNSLNNYIRHMRSALNKAEEWGYVKKNPLAGVKEIRGNKRLPNYLDRKDIPKFLATIKDEDLRRIVTAYIATGRRRDELLNLRWKDVDLDGLSYRIRKSKAKLEKIYPINKLFMAVLLSVGPRDEGRVFTKWRHPDTVSHKVKAALVAAGFQSLRLHDLRHTFASIQAGKGTSLIELKELLGHAEIKATMIYSHLTNDRLREIAEVEIGPVDLGKK